MIGFSGVSVTVERNARKSSATTRGYPAIGLRIRRHRAARLAVGALKEDGMHLSRRQYQRPELVELGPATALTLGAIGCTNDGHCCQKFIFED